MTLDLSRIEFENDVFTYETDAGTLMFYALDENPPLGGGEASYKRVVIALVDSEGAETILSSVIGLEWRGYTVRSEHVELEGGLLTLDNIALCTLETPE